MEDGNWGALLQHYGVYRVKMFVRSSKYSFTGWFLGTPLRIVLSALLTSGHLTNHQLIDHQEHTSS
jgi:hypothetical protein